MRTAAAFFVCAGAALLAILLASSSPHAQPVTSGQGLSRVVHDTSMVGSGTTAIPLGLRRNCATNEILKWNGSTWACATPSAGDVTGVTVTSPACSAGSFVATLTGGAATGDAPVGGTCVAEVGDISNVGGTANGGLTGGGASGAVTLGLLTTCGDGQVLAWTAGTTSWGCASASGESTIAGAGLTLTGTTVNLIGSSDFSVGADLLDLSTAVTAPGSLDVTTDLTIGGGQVHFTGLEMNFGYNTNATTSGYLNYAGYLHGVTQFRDLTIADGKNATVATFTGSTKAMALFGAANVTGLVTATAGVTTPANLTTTGTGDLVVADAATITGLTTTTGGLTSTAAATAVGNFSGQRIAASLTANVNDWAPTGIGTAMVIDLTSVSAGPFAILGISSTGSVAGRVLVLLNNGGNTFQVNNEAGTSLAANRIKTTGGATRTIGNYGSMSIVWNGTNWSEIAEASRFTPELYSLGAAHVDGVTDLIGNVNTYANSVFGDAGGDTHTVNGSMTITNGLTVQSSGVLIQSGLTANDNVILGSASTTTTKIYRPETTGTAPTPSTCGTSPTSTGGLWAIKMTLGTGTAASCTVALPFAASPICTLGSEITTRGDLVISALSATSITVTSVSGANMASGKINVICVGDG